MIQVPNQKGFQDRTVPTRKKLISTGGASQNPDSARSRMKRLREAGSRIDSAPGTEITKIETAVLTVGRGNTPI
ncbi:hypothetical protein PHMEG_00032467 [Phytophthora megakarya]|uniref:Uncharacterized protein n=1 Tax=Phytophthora megakarya TaxID=4795 RepID=A0A225UXV5_9STRA|nr:hypothetical protein PHMEG_00032467 [Phytophthora megakarya]